MIRAGLLLILLTRLATGEVPSDVALTVNGESVSMRGLEDELLRREGVDLARRLVAEALTKVAWPSMRDDARILTVGERTFSRQELAMVLLEQDGDRVREELIGIALARQACKRAGLVPTPVMLEREVARWERRLQDRLRQQGARLVSLADWVRLEQGKSFEEWQQEEGFRLAACINELAHRSAEIDETTLAGHFQSHGDRFIVPEAVRLSLIDLPFRVRQIGGRTTIDPSHRETLPNTARALYDQIVQGKGDFAAMHAVWGRAYDPCARSGGEIGWVDRQGRPSVPGCRQVPEEILQIAFQVRIPVGGLLLPPIEHATGVALVWAWEHRTEVRPTFEQAHDRVRSDWVEEHLDDLRDTMMTRWRQDARIERGSLGDHLQRRRDELQPAGSPQGK